MRASRRTTPVLALAALVLLGKHCLSSPSPPAAAAPGHVLLRSSAGGDRIAGPPPAQRLRPVVRVAPPLDAAAPPSLTDALHDLAANAIASSSASSASSAFAGSSAAIDTSCEFPPGTPAPCQFPLDPVALFAAGATARCTPASATSGIPWSVVVCGPHSSWCPRNGVSNGETPDGDSVAIVGIHGGPGQSSGILRQLAQIAYATAAEQIPVILYDQAGAGRSADLPAAFQSGDNIEDTMKSYVAELRSVLQTYGVSRAHLVGHSFGAAIAIDFATSYPDLTTSLSLLSPTVDGVWWRQDADLHRAYLPRPVSPAGDPTASNELLFRWVLGDQLSMDDLGPFLCRPSDTVYSTVWGKSEDVPDGQVSDFHREAALTALADGSAGVRLPILLGGGMLDEAPPARLLQLAATLDAARRKNGGGPDTHVVTLPHSAHVIANIDWHFYVRTLHEFVRAAEAARTTSSNPSADGDATAAAAGPAPPAPRWPGPLVTPPNLAASRESEAHLLAPGLVATLDSFRKTLHALEADATSVAHRSYPYLGRLLCLKQAPPGGFQQLGREAMRGLLNPSQRSGGDSGLDWDSIQAVVDVWYVASIIDPDKYLEDPTLRPPPELLAKLAQRMQDERSSSSPIDRIMAYVVGKALARLQVDGAPKFAPFSWRELASGIDMRGQFPVVYMYLLTHVYIYNTDFGTLPVAGLRDGSVMAPASMSAGADGPTVAREIDAAVAELIELAPLALEVRGGPVVFAGMMDPHEAEVPLDTVYDIVCEIFFTIVRVHGRQHPMAVALSERVREYLTSRPPAEGDSDRERGHFAAVCLASWVVWGGGKDYM